MEERGRGFLEAVDPQVDGEFGWSSMVTETLNGASWSEAYRVLRDRFCIPGEDASDLVMRREQGELLIYDPADIGALD